MTAYDKTDIIIIQYILNTICCRKMLKNTINFANKNMGVFDGDRESDAVWTNNNYVLQAGYKKASKVKKNMKISAKVYVPVAVLKKDGDTVKNQHKKRIQPGTVVQRMAFG